MMDASRWTPLLLDVLRARVPAAAFTWLDGASGQISGPNRRTALLDAYTTVPRQMGRAPLALTEDEAASAAAIDADVEWATWSIADLARALLLQRASASAAVESEAVELLLAPYEEGDSSEQRSWLRSLPVLPHAERLVPTAIDACRTNILPQFEAIACENPFPSRHFPDRNFNQLVLKALFNNLALMRIVGLERRFNAELSRMADDYVSEREAAGRSVPPDIWLVIGPHATGRSLDRMQRYLHDEDPAHRHWAAIGLGLAQNASSAGAPNVQRS